MSRQIWFYPKYSLIGVFHPKVNLGPRYFSNRRDRIYFYYPNKIWPMKAYIWFVYSTPSKEGWVYIGVL